MDFSHYVMKALSSIDYLEKDKDFNARSLLKGMAEKAENDTDSHILDVISGCLSMSYNIEDQVFAPFLIEYGVGRSFAPEDLSEEDIGVLYKVIDATRSVWLKTRCAHIVWFFNKEHSFGELAVTGYLDIYKKSFNTEHWSSCFNKIQIAYQISSEIGKKSSIFKQVRTQILQDLELMNGSDPLFLSLQMLELIWKDLKKGELPKFASIAEKLFYKNTNPENNNTHLADDSFSILKAFYDRLKRNDELRAAKEQYGRFYEAHARKFAAKSDHIRAVFFMKSACLIYVDVDCAKARDLRLEMESWQQMAMKHLHSFKTTIDVKEMASTVDQMFRELTLSEAIIQFGRMSKIYRVDEVREKVLAEQDQYFFTTMWGTSILNKQGQIVQEIPPITGNEDDAEILHKHMVHHVSKRRRHSDYIPVEMAFRHLRQFGNIPEEALDFLVQDNAFIPDNRAEIIKEGLCLALNGKLYMAMHILLPQTENIFRCLVKLCGDTVTFLSKDGTEEYKPLSSLFKSDKLRECYDENLIFCFQSILEDAAGENLRNLMAHGLLEPNEGSGKAVLCFLSMLIKLLSMYSKKANLILSKLIDAQEVDTQS